MTDQPIEQPQEDNAFSADYYLRQILLQIDESEQMISRLITQSGKKDYQFLIDKMTATRTAVLEAEAVLFSTEADTDE